MTGDGSFGIGEVAARSGLSRATLRYYEAAGLLPPTRRVGGRRRYDAASLDHLAAIRLARAAGCSIAATRAFLAALPPDASPATGWRELAATRLPALDAQIARAQEQRRMLETGLRCACSSLADCAATLACDTPGTP